MEEGINAECFQDLAVAVDLTPMRPGGANGGIKPAIFSMLAEAVKQPQTALFFIYLTNSATHEEVRRFSRSRDILICVRNEPEFPLEIPSTSTRTEFKLTPPPKHFLQRVGADVLYSPFGACTFQAPGVPTVALIADLLHRDYPLTLTEEQIAQREDSIGRTVKEASMIQCLSRSGVERMIEHYQVPEEKLFYTHLPIQVRLEADALPPTSQDFMRKAGIESPFFFYPANLWKHKNHEMLLRAYRLYREQAGEEAWHLVLTFHEDSRAVEIRQLAEELGISQSLHLPGYVPEAGLRALWQSAGALVFPSLHEGFGIPIVEAMHYGVPIITGWDFSLKEIAGDACYRIDARNPESIAEALFKVSRDSNLREALIRKGKQRLGFYDLGLETRKLVEIWKSLPQRADGFPHKPRVLELSCALAVPTPASDELWDVEVQVNPRFLQNRYSVYLEDCAYGSFSPALEQKEAFHFQCRPQSRTLRVVIDRDRTVAGNDAPVFENAIHSIVTRNRKGETLSLFKNTLEVIQ